MKVAKEPGRNVMPPSMNSGNRECLRFGCSYQPSANPIVNSTVPSLRPDLRARDIKKAGRLFPRRKKSDACTHAREEAERGEGGLGWRRVVGALVPPQDARQLVPRLVRLEGRHE